MCGYMYIGGLEGIQVGSGSPACANDQISKQ